MTKTTSFSSPAQAQFSPPTQANIRSLYEPQPEEMKAFAFVAFVGVVLLMLALGLLSDQISDAAQRALQAVSR